MSSLRSSSPSRSKESSSSNGPPVEGSLSARRPSWTPSVPESSKRRPRHSDENSPLSPEWMGSVSSHLKTRRPSFPPSLPESYQRARKPRVETEDSPEISKGSSGNPLVVPEESKSLRSSWEINVKDLVGDAVGNMSISPTSRDIVLAARRGLFIIELEEPLSIPRFLPQGGTWDVADVQWNPHISHSQYIVSTSSEKLLIWNLLLGGKTSIQHILKSHYRAITDINWHTTECNIVASTGIDSWVWAWDLRTPEKPIFGLSAFNAGGTQVKWNRQDGNILASSHLNQVLIWDRRKGSLPITRIPAHSAKIYGIDWSHSNRNEIVTCSLDKSIKIWDINSTNDQCTPEPISCIQTTYPVWRARNLPFGEGILSLPQRGETTLEMYAKGDSPNLVETFEGHSDVVKEFVWRKGDHDDFQLITWSKDRTLRFWPIGMEVMQKVGYLPELIRGRSKIPRAEQELHGTFRKPPKPESSDNIPALSAPIGNRNIFAEVRAPRSMLSAQVEARANFSEPPSFVRDLTPTTTSRKRPSASVVRSVGGTMSKGGLGVKSIVQVDQLAWLASVKVGNRRGSSSGDGSHGESGTPSRMGSGSRPPSALGRGLSENGGTRHSSGSLGRTLEVAKEVDSNQSLQDEITSVLTKLTAANHKINLERHDLSKKRMCTLGLHGPWGETSSVFMRVTFNFPRDYPQATYPHGTPTVELERNPLITLRTRAFILKHLRRIREQTRPCLEACLRFLLLAHEDQAERQVMDSDSSSDDDGEQSKKKEREITVSLLRNHKNLAEPRTSQGVFGPNGELICFFRAPTRVVRNVLRDTIDADARSETETAPVIPEEPPPPPVEEPSTPAPAPPSQLQSRSYFQSPALVSDAVRRLGLAATDRIVRPIDPNQPEAGLDILRAMTNLLTVPQHKVRRDSEPKHSAVVKKNVAIMQARRSIIFVTSTRNIASADKKVVDDYIFMADSLAVVCEQNAVSARKHGRYDHERVFKTLRTLFKDLDPESKKREEASFTSDSLAAQVVTRIYNDISREKDLQMLAMVGMLILQTEHATIIPQPPTPRKQDIPTVSGTPIPPVPSRLANDYFSLTKSLATHAPHTPVSPVWPRLPSPIAPFAATSVTPSNSSRGSWSSLFNTGSVRQFMSGMQDTFKEGLTTPGETPAITTSKDVSRSAEKLTMSRLESPGGTGLRRKRNRKDSWMYGSQTQESKSWNEGTALDNGKGLTSSFSSAGNKLPSLRFADSTAFIHEHKVVVFEPSFSEEMTRPLFAPNLIMQFRRNVYSYCELLFRWQMYTKRLELLKAVKQPDTLADPKPDVHRIGLHRVCTRSDCRTILQEKALVCPQCNTFCSMPTCTICRLPVKGLSRTCLTCSHVTHISCSKSFEVTVPICPSGCGCFCTGADGTFTRPSTRLGMTPPAANILLS